MPTAEEIQASKLALLDILFELVVQTIEEKNTIN